MVTVDDIAAAVKARCDAGFLAVILGGGWFQRPGEEATTPYAVFGIERAGDVEYLSDGSYIQNWIVRMAAYSSIGTTDPNAVQQAMSTALNANPTTWTALRDGRVMHCLPQGFDGKFVPQLRQARDVFVAGGQWRILVEGNREA